MATLEEILLELRTIKADVKSTHDKLWGENGFKGDIQEIIARLECIEQQQKENEKQQQEIDRQTAVNKNDIVTIYKRLGQFPVSVIGSKWFWIIMMVIVLACLGLSVTDIKGIISSVLLG